MSSLNKLLYSEDSSIPILEKKILLKYILNTSNEEINISHDKLLDHIELSQYKELIQRRKKSEPIAYIINKKEFWKDTFFIDNSVLIPRPDSEIIIETAIKYFPDTNQNLKMLDLGTGSGCLIISLLREFKNSQGIGIDFDKKALKVAKQNKSNLLNENRLKFCHADFSKFNTINYELIVCNPPYVSTSSKVEDKEKLLEEISLLISSLTNKSKRFVMAKLDDNCEMYFNDGNPCCFLEIKSIGSLNPSDMAKPISDFLYEKMGIPMDQIYISFVDVPASLWAWNGRTFG